MTGGLWYIAGKMFWRGQTELEDQNSPHPPPVDSLSKADHGLGMSVQEQKLYQVLHRKVIINIQQLPYALDQTALTSLILKGTKGSIRWAQLVHSDSITQSPLVDHFFPKHSRKKHTNNNIQTPHSQSKALICPVPGKEFFFTRKKKKKAQYPQKLLFWFIKGSDS